MRTGVGCIAAILAIAGLMPTASPAADRPVEPRKCGGIVLEQIGVYAIQSSGLQCRGARRVAMHWLARLSCGVPACRIGKFQCRGRALDPEGERLRVRCGYSGRLVQFRYGTVRF
jgi:hypothetical protein